MRRRGAPPPGDNGPGSGRPSGPTVSIGPPVQHGLSHVARGEGGVGAATRPFYRPVCGLRGLADGVVDGVGTQCPVRSPVRVIRIVWRWGPRMGRCWTLAISHPVSAASGWSSISGVSPAETVVGVQESGPGSSVSMIISWPPRLKVEGTSTCCLHGPVKKRSPQGKGETGVSWASVSGSRAASRAAGHWCWERVWKWVVRMKRTPPRVVFLPR